TFRVILFSIHSDEWKSFQSQHQTALRIRRWRYNLTPAELKFKTPMLDHQDKYMMKAQVHVSKSSAISDKQPLPRRKHYCQIYQVVKHMLKGRLLATFQDHEHKGGDTRSLAPAKSNSYYQAFNVKSLFGEIVSVKKSQVKLKSRFIIKITKHECLKPLQSRISITRTAYMEQKEEMWPTLGPRNVFRFTWVFFLATKDETSPILKTFITGLENQLSLKVKVIRSDNGTEFKNNDLNQFCRIKGIKREFSVPRTPQQNGIAERKNRTLIEAARTMLADSLLPIPFWAEAVNTACYVQNRVLVTKPHNKTLYELLHGRTPSIGFMRPFGYLVTILNTLDSLRKFEGKVDEGFLVGYSVNSKAFRVFNSRIRIVQKTLHVNFLENKLNVASCGPTWLFDIDSLTKTMNYQPVNAGNQTNLSSGFQDKFDAEKAGEEVDQQYVLFPVWSSGSTNPQNNDKDAAFDGKEHDFDVNKPKSEVILSLSNSAQSRKQDDKTKKEAKGKSHVESFTGYRNLNTEFEDCSDNSSNEVNDAGYIVPTVRQNFLNSTNTFSATGPSNAAFSPTYRKSSFIDASQLPDDPDMPELEDITYSDDEDVVGAEADFNNLESSITASLIPTTRIHKDHPISQIIGDLSLTTQTRSMTRVVKDPGGLSQMFNDDFHTCMFACFFSQEEPKRVHQALKDLSWIEAMQKELFQFKMQKVWVLVDLPHGKRAIARIEDIRLFLAYASFMGFMMYQMDIKSSFLYGTIEEEVYVCQPPGLEDPDHPDKVYKVVKALYGLHQAPTAWYETLATYLLENGFQRGTIDQRLFIKKHKGDILLVQIYVDDIIFGATNKDLCKSFEKLMIDKFQMSSMGELTFFLGLQVKKKKDGIFISQDKYVAKILRKFRLTKGKSASTPIDIEKPLLKDPDGEDVDVHTYKLMIGSLMYLTSSRPDIMFACKKQTVIATSSTEAEYVAAASCCAQVLWIQNQLLDYGVFEKNVTCLIYLNYWLSHHTTNGSQFTMSNPHKNWLVQKQMALGKDSSNSLMAGNLPKIIWYSTHHVTLMKSWLAQKQTALDQDDDVALMDDKEEDKKDEEAKEDEPAKVQEVVDIVTTANAASVRVAVASIKRRKGVVIRDLEEESTTSSIILDDTKFNDKGKGIMVEEPKPLKKKQQVKMDEEYARKLHAELNKDIDWDVAIDHTEAQARKNRIIYLKNVVGFRLDYFKGMSYDDIRLIFEAKFNSNIEFLLNTKEQIEEEENRALQSINETPAQKAGKRRKLNKEVEDLKRNLEVVPDEDDDVYTESTPLARKVPVVDYEIITLKNKPYYKIIRADGTHQLFISFLTLLKNFDREDLEALWNLVKERFSTSKPKNFSDDFLLTTLGAMFEKPDTQAQVWKNQRSIHGQVMVKRWKLQESCGVHIITFSTTQLILLVERRYPLSRFTLYQMLNAVRL
nr:hypothetical protein [Tanacetum cinerariifolium]